MTRAGDFVRSARALSPADAIDTQKRPRFNFRSGANIYWVNTTTDDKALAGLRFTRFESFPAAVRNIVEGKR